MAPCALGPPPAPFDTLLLGEGAPAWDRADPFDQEVRLGHMEAGTCATAFATPQAPEGPGCAFGGQVTRATPGPR